MVPCAAYESDHDESNSKDSCDENVDEISKSVGSDIDVSESDSDSDSDSDDG